LGCGLCRSVKGVSYTRTDISVGRGCLTGMPVEVRWFFITGFLVMGYFQGVLNYALQQVQQVQCWQYYSKDTGREEESLAAIAP
jgi:hypothetical protein